MRVDALDDLAIQLHDQPQHAVRGRVLRTKVDRVIAELLVARIARLVELAPQPAGADADLDLARLGAGSRVAHVFFFRGFFAGAFFGLIGAGPLAAGAGEGAPGASPTAFSSPGSRYSGPSHGIRKSKLRKSWGSETGS